MILNPKKLIIMRSDLATPQQRLTTLGILIFFGGIALYLIHKLSAALGWGLAFFFYNRTIGDSSGLSGFLDMASAYLPLVAIFCGAFVGWAIYNKLRFSGPRDKRQCGQFSLSNTEIANFFQLEEKAVESLQKSQVTDINYDNSGDIVGFVFS